MPDALDAPVIQTHSDDSSCSDSEMDAPPPAPTPCGRTHNSTVRRSVVSAAQSAEAGSTVDAPVVQTHSDDSSCSDSETDAPPPAPTPCVRTRNSVRLSARTIPERWPVGTMVASTFDSVTYIASVTHILPATDDDEKLWHVVYEDDDDEEDLNEKEMESAYELYLNGVGGDNDS